MPIKFKCPHCKKALSVKEHLAGKKASCPTCKKALLIPTPAAKTTAPPETPPETPPVDVDAIAAAALQDEPTNGKHVEVTDTIDFKCEFCEAEIQVPRADSGKRMQCPNAECRSIIKVPAPKDGPKKLPTVAQLTQVEKIDEAAWGTQTDKSHVHKESFKEAGAMPPVQRRPIGPREYIQRSLIGVAVVAGLALACYGFVRVNQTQREKGFVETALSYVEPGKNHDPKDMVQDPVARGEVYRAIARYRLSYSPEKKRSEVLDAIQKALASVQLRPGIASSVERDLFLGELAVTATELGGTEDEDRGKEKYDWKSNQVRDTLSQIMQAIKAPEARVIGMRALTTRLLELDQTELEIGVASQLSNGEGKGARRPPVTSQLVVLLLMKDKAGDTRVKAPNGKDATEPLARTGYAEFNARKGNLEEAKNLVKERGPLQDRLDACVGVADVLLQGKNAKASDAEWFVDEAINLAKALPDTKKAVPWLVLQTIRLGARVRGPDAVRELAKKLPESFQPCGYLELLRAEAQRNNKEALGIVSLSDIRDANANSSSVDLGWEALARQNALVHGNEVDALVREEENRRYRAMVHIGRGLSGVERK